MAFRKRIYRPLDELQADFDRFVTEQNQARPHQGRWCYGKTLLQTFLASLALAKDKMHRLARGYH